MTEVVINCKSWQQAQTLADMLLSKNLAQSVELMAVKPKAWRRQPDPLQVVRLIVATSQPSVVKVAGRQFKKTWPTKPRLRFVDLKVWLAQVLSGRL